MKHLNVGKTGLNQIFPHQLGQKPSDLMNIIRQVAYLALVIGHVHLRFV